ncbi:hypothetical protein F4779DRAFT_618175 [Xylariaceae sp. FL0662B]|nr:hypothetical protein F4779DRAFT_618175 [Xylariaceae sp. FL0662B]
MDKGTQPSTSDPTSHNKFTKENSSIDRNEFNGNVTNGGPKPSAPEGSPENKPTAQGTQSRWSRSSSGSDWEQLELYGGRNVNQVQEDDIASTDRLLPEPVGDDGPPRQKPTVNRKGHDAPKAFGNTSNPTILATLRRKSRAITRGLKCPIRTTKNNTSGPMDKAQSVVTNTPSRARRNRTGSRTLVGFDAIQQPSYGSINRGGTSQQNVGRKSRRRRMLERLKCVASCFSRLANYYPASRRSQSAAPNSTITIAAASSPSISTRVSGDCVSCLELM